MTWASDSNSLCSFSSLICKMSVTQRDPSNEVAVEVHEVEFQARSLAYCCRASLCDDLPEQKSGLLEKLGECHVPRSLTPCSPEAPGPRPPEDRGGDIGRAPPSSSTSLPSHSPTHFSYWVLLFSSWRMDGPGSVTFCLGGSVLRFPILRQLSVLELHCRLDPSLGLRI